MSEIWNKILSGDLKDKIKDGFMVIGQNTSDYTLSTWHYESETDAVSFAEHISRTTGGCYEIIKYEFFGVVRPAKLPTEYVKPKIDQPSQESDRDKEVKKETL